MFSALFGLVGSFLSSKVGPPLFLVIGAVAALGWGMWYMEDKAHGDTKITLGEQKGQTQKAVEANEALALANRELQVQREKDKVNSESEAREMAALRKENNEVNEKYDAMRSRMAGVMSAKGSLIARRANRATGLLVTRLEDGTCRAGCGGDEDTEGDTPTGEPASGAEPSGL